MLSTVSKFAILSSLAILASACASAFNGPQHALTVAEEHPISVDSQIVTMTIDADATRDELSDMDKARLRAFANAYLTQGHGPMAITAPSGSDQDFDGQEMAADIRQALNDAGVPWSAMSGATYRKGGAGDDNQLILSYTHYVATASECGVWTDNTMRRYRNIRSANYGCATMNNIAAMLADPHDLVAPAALGARDATIAVRAIDAYREGELTVSEIDKTIDSEVSNK